MLEQHGYSRFRSRWLNAARADNPVGLWVPGVNQSGTTLRSSSPGWSEKVRRSVPVAWWRLGEASGSSAVEEIAGRNGSYVGSPTLGVTGPLGDDPDKGITLNGTSQYVSVPFNAALHPGDTFTFSIWFKRGTLAVAQYVVDNGANDFAVLLDVDNRIYVQKRGVSNVWSSTATFTDASWHDLVVAKSGATMAVYVDGVAVAGTFVNATIVAASGETRLGAKITGTEFFSGSLDEPKIYDRALSADEIADLYLAGISTHTATLTGGVTTGVAGPHPGGSTALDYDGAGDYLTIPANAALRPDQFTIEGWVNFDAIPGTVRRMWGAAVGTTGFYAEVNTSGDFIATIGNGASNVATNTAGARTAGQWYHVAQTYDATNQRLYVDGALVDTDPVAISKASVALEIGSARGAAATNGWDGRIGGVAIYRTALSAADVLRHYNAGR